MSAAITITSVTSGAVEQPGKPVQWRAYGVALALHVVALASLVELQRSHSIRVGVVGPPQDRIGAFVLPSPSAPATTVSKPVPKPIPVAPKTTPVDTPTPAASAQSPASGQPAESGTQTGAPVRLGSGDQLRLLNKIQPVYPPIMQTARVEGTVVLDAVIHRDGTIGDITVLKSSAPAFERAAIDAVKQWRYTPLSYEGIVTVTLNFTLRT